ncbi:hypothetical protein [Endozoicomonas atrinae]|uniref:hypothetical protein n=1 Tax=Endozoicomonas atrinae TaxID=1333660 RepID=UPI003B00FF21
MDTLLKLPSLQKDGQLDRQLLSSISSICHGKGFPKAGDVDTLLKLPSLQKDGQLDRQLLSSISSMMSSRGFPKAGDVDTLLKLPSLQKDGQLDRQLLSSIASICHGKGFPNETLVSLIVESIGLNNLELPEYIHELLSSETFDFDENFWDSLSIDERL